MSPWHRAFADAAGDDAIVHTANVRGTTRWNAGFAYLDPARSRTNLTIRAQTLVDRVVVEAGRAVGLATEDGEVRARTVVVAAGAYGSPAILLRSGLDPALPVGLGLQDHVGVGLGFESTAVLQGEAARFAAEYPVFMAQVTMRARSSRCEPGLWDLFHIPALEERADGQFETSAATFVMRSRSRGSVRLASDDPRVPPIVDHGLLADPVDAEVLAEGIAHLRALVASEGLDRLAASGTRPGPDVSPVEHARAAARGFFHPTGTCAIGSVVDAECCVLGVEGLYVADASVMPEVPRVNTNLPTAAIAERVADAAGRHRRLSGRSEYDRGVAADAIHFTGDREADALLARDPLALLIGFALDQQVTVQKAFSGPLELQQRLGTLDAGTIAATDPPSSRRLPRAARDPPLPRLDGEAGPGARAFIAERVRRRRVAPLARGEGRRRPRARILGCPASAR